MKSELHKIIGKRLKDYRLKHGLQQKRIAELSGLSQDYLSKVENGKIGMRLNSLIRVQEAYGISLEELLDGK